MGLLNDIQPLNLLEEKARFFLDFNYNPQFVYRREFEPAELLKWGVPNQKLVDICLERMKDYQPPEQYKQEDYVTKSYIIEYLERFKSGLRPNIDFTYLFSNTFHARCTITKNKIIFREPIEYNQKEFEDLMRHELETHFLRRYNHALQPWSDIDFPEEEIRTTEEGLATLHTYLFRDEKHMYKPYINYLATHFAQQYSFSDTFKALKTFGLKNNKAWSTTLRVKRGLTDTSTKGGLTKDMCYLTGAIKVWHWLQQPQHSVYDLYAGRITVEAVDSLKPTAITKGLVFPEFIKDQSVYLKAIADIGTSNSFKETDIV